MTDRADLLIELGTEELPPKALNQLAEAFYSHVSSALVEAGLDYSEDGARFYAAPRRMAIFLPQLLTRQADVENTRLGPAVDAAFDNDGNPKPAAMGFAKSCGVDVADLERIETDKGLRLGAVQKVSGKETADLVVPMIEQALAALPIPKRMRWGDSDAEFVRPVHWVMGLLGEQSLKGSILGQAIGNRSQGHRFHHGDWVQFDKAADYSEKMRDAYVLVCPEQRRSQIAEHAKELAAECGGQVQISDDLLDEVASLAEWPVGYLCSFDKEFLEVPSEALISSMEHHQKFFALRDASGALQPNFVAFANIESKEPDVVRDGFERVIRPRLADAQFFWQQDLKKSLDDRATGLAKMTYQKQLGSLADKVARAAALADKIASEIGADQNNVARAAQLSKSDLLSEMVGEFPDLQGLMGRYYALAQGENETVAHAIEQHYWPRMAGDSLPESKEAASLALADRLDTLAGIFAIGAKPTGNKDPFGLRRAALGVVRILVERGFALDLRALVQSALAQLPDGLAQDESVLDEIWNFLLDRARGYYQDQGFSADTFAAVRATDTTDMADFDKRMHACRDFAKLPEAASLAAANKRIGNILKKADAEDVGIPVTTDFKQIEETALHEALVSVQGLVQPMLDAGEYTEALQQLAQLRDEVDQFFDAVMVMDEDLAVRRNRLALLSDVKGLFDQIADISRLELG